MMERAHSTQSLCTRMRLWDFPDHFVFEPTDASSSPPLLLSISRLDASLSLIDKLPDCSSSQAPEPKTVFGLLGLLKLVSGSYFIVITEYKNVGTYLGHPIVKISGLKVYSCGKSSNSTAHEKKMEAEFSSLLNIAEKTTGLYFSYEMNLSLSLQKLHELGDQSQLLPLWRQAEPRFIWNNYMLEPLIENKLDPFIIPVVQGSFQQFQAAIGKDTFDVTLIARRCTKRTGTRMWRRGADSDGYVANFVETEQVLNLNGYAASFVQVRGSIPLLWEQIVDLTYKPKFELVRIEEAPKVAERHFLDLRKKYGSVLAVDLINKHGGEGRLCDKYAEAMEHVKGDDVRYLHFDFHRICGHVRFDRLSILYEQISDFLNQNGYFLSSEKGEKMKEQFGVVRSNCIDCLDRTNVTQSMIGRKMLESQLRRLGVFGDEETIKSHPDLDKKFKILWADHGDEISIQYSGTPALKGDFVRYGQRTVQGILNDGWNALARYYLNNFRDGEKQDAMDLLQGHYIVSVGRDLSPPPQKATSLEAVASFPLALSVVLAGFFFATMSLRQGRSDYRHLFFALICTSLSVVLAVVVRSNGRVFCNRPRLHKPRS